MSSVPRPPGRRVGPAPEVHHLLASVVGANAAPSSVPLSKFPWNTSRGQALEPRSGRAVDRRHAPIIVEPVAPEASAASGSATRGPHASFPADEMDDVTRHGGWRRRERYPCVRTPGVVWPWITAGNQRGTPAVPGRCRAARTAALVVLALLAGTCGAAPPSTVTSVGSPVSWPSTCRPLQHPGRADAIIDRRRPGCGSVDVHAPCRRPAESERH